MNFKQFSQELACYKPEEIIFVGLGNELCGDDAAGLIFIDKLKDVPDFTGSIFITARTNPENFLQKILDSTGKVIVFIDAAQFNGKRGEISWIDADNLELLSISTHAYSLRMVEQYLLNYRHFDFKYLGIDSLHMNLGDQLSSQVLTKIAVFFAHVRNCN
ncbi:hydrogenase maturation protease [candidate division KSB1 bacterium]|nr:hydrogenase maturation protease [candidate division KSB1 bacterium]